MNGSGGLLNPRLRSSSSYYTSNKVLRVGERRTGGEPTWGIGHSVTTRRVDFAKIAISVRHGTEFSVKVAPD